MSEVCFYLGLGIMADVDGQGNVIDVAVSGVLP